MKIVWDLDGVLRDLSGYVARINKCKYPSKWEELYNGKTLFQCIDENLNILLLAPPTAYITIVKKHFKWIEIWTCQPEHWREYTSQWIDLKFNGIKTSVYFLTTKEKEERIRSRDDVILIEDSPKFENYDRIFLIDRTYNQNIKGCLRIFGPKHLNNVIEIVKEM